MKEKKEGSSRLRLLVDFLPAVSTREKVVGLQHVSFMAVDGSSGLDRLITEEFNQDVKVLLEEGKHFLERVLLDIDRYRNGIDTSSLNNKIAYNPRVILETFAYSTAANRNETPETAAQIAADKMESTAKDLLNNIHSLLGKQKAQEKTRKLVSILQRYLQISAPYLMVTSQAMEEFRRR